MSVVNKMLNDLEKRGASDGRSANYVPPAKASRPRVWIWSAVIIVSLAVLALFLFPQAQSPVSGLPATGLPATGVPATGLPAKSVPTAMQVPTQTVTKQAAQRAASPEPIPETATQQDVNAAKEQTAVLPRTHDTQPEMAPELAESVPETGDDVAEEASSTSSSMAAQTPAPAAVLTVTAEKSAAAPNAGLRERIRLAFEAGNRLQAIALMQELRAREPDNLALTKKLAASLFAEGQMTAARTVLTEQLAAQPAEHSVRLMLARLYVQQGQTPRALEELIEADRYAPLSLALLAYRGELLREQQRFDRALDDYVQLSAREPGNARWWLGLGVCADSLQQAQQARAAYQQALALEQLDPEVDAYLRSRIERLAGGER